MIMMKTASTRHSSQSSAVFIAATVAALLGNLQVAEAKKPKVDPAIAAAITTASTSNIEDITALGSGIGTQIANKSIKLTPTNVNALVGGLVNAINTKTENP